MLVISMQYGPIDYTLNFTLDFTKQLAAICNVNCIQNEIDSTVMCIKPWKMHAQGEIDRLAKTTNRKLA